jgi:peptide/nickel transport system permease protein
VTKRVAAHAGSVLAIAFFALALVGPWLAPRSPRAIDLRHAFELPSAAHWLGTADNGVDILSILLHGARLAGIVALGSVALSLIVGAPLGAFAGTRGGWADRIVTGLADLVQSFPSIVLHVAVVALVARPSVIVVVLALAANGWAPHARLARAQALSVRERDFVLAARALGASEARVIARHVLPSLAGPLIVSATSALGAAVLAESTLSFLGLGPGLATSWGALLDQGASVLLRFPHVALVSGGALALTVLALNLAGDELRDRLDPRA